jgi:CheY-like chemotaxis protein
MDNMLRRLIGEHIELITRPQPGLGRIKADPGQLEQVIMNLVINACDAMSQGGQLTIETANMRLDEAYTRQQVNVTPGPHVMLVVSDTGTGMDADTIAHIFEPFYTTKEVGKGTGLGLATVYGIVTQSGGHLQIHSEIGQGTTFKIYFPQIKEIAEVSERDNDQTHLPNGLETILLVEDEPSIRALIHSILKKNGYAVLHAANGQEALEVSRQYPAAINLLLTDVVIPKMTGRELAERLTSLRPDLKVLYMSGYTNDAMIQHGVLDMRTAFLYKPFTPDDLARKVRQVLDAK